MDFDQKTLLTEDEIDIMAASPDFIEHPVGEVLYSFKKEPRKIRIYTGDSVMCVGPGGSGCIIRPRIFMKKDSTVVEGFVDLYITDVVSYADMIYNGVSTMSSTGFLKSAGIIDIVAVQHSDTLLLIPGKTVDVTVLAPWTIGLSVYTGIVQPTAENSITWQPGEGTVIPGNQQILAIGLDTLTWTNVATPVTMPSAGTVSATIPSQFAAASSLIYLLLEKGTILNLIPGANGVYINPASHQVPAGMNAKLVVVSKANNKYYYSEKAFVTTGTNTIDFPVIPEVTINQLHVKLEAL